MTDPDPLCDPIATTALFTRAGAGEDADVRVVALDDSEAAYTDLRPNDDALPFRKDADRPPHIVVQLRKRQRKMELFIDGHRSEGTPINRRRVLRTTVVASSSNGAFTFPRFEIMLSSALGVDASDVKVRAELASTPAPSNQPVEVLRYNLSIAVTTTILDARALMAKMNTLFSDQKLMKSTFDAYVESATQSTLTSDDSVSEGREHRIYWHSGMHRDPDTLQHVFSPIAIACAIEDSQRPPRNVRVGVWQTHVDSSGHELHQPVLLSETNLRPHLLSSTRCRAAYVPFPMGYQALPVVTIFDDRISRNAANGRRLSYAQRVWSKLGDLITTGQMDPNGVNISEWAALLGLSYVSSTYMGITGAASTWIYVKDLMRAQRGGNRDPVIFGIRSLLELFGEFLVKPALPEPQRVSLSLKELARTLETLTALRESDNAGSQSIDSNAASAATSEKQLRKLKASISQFGTSEQMLWDWLTSDLAANTGLPGMHLLKGTDKAQRATFFADDLLNISKPRTAVHIRIDVDDSFECEQGSPATMHHEIRATEEVERNYYLSQAASGTLDDLSRIETALNIFIAQLESSDVFEKTTIYWSLYRPLVDAFKYIKKKAVDPTGAFSVAEAKKRSAQWLGMAAKDFEEFAEPTKKHVENAKKSIKKLAACFLEPGGEGFELKRRITTALISKGAPLATEGSEARWIRRLPQRVGVSNFTYLFKAGEEISTEHMDVVTAAAIIREHTTFHDATKALKMALRSGERYLRRKVPQWEARSATRVKLALLCTTINEENAPAHRDGDACFSTLTLSTPIDVLFAGAVTRFPEESLRCLRFVVKRAQQQCDKSVLEALGLRHTSEDLLACQVFGDLWADELITMRKRDEAVCAQMQMLEQASRRAAARLRALGTLLLEVFTVLEQADAAGDDEDEIAPEIADVVFRATLAGRDAARMLGRLLFARDDFEVRSVMTPTVRRSAAAAVRAAGVFERAVPARLPHEPLASLFGDRSDCVAALLRSTKLFAQYASEEEAAGRCAMVAAYASARMMSDEESEHYARALTAVPPPEWPDENIKSVADLLASMRYRMASLRIDYNVLSLANELENMQVNDLAGQLDRAAKLKAEKQGRAESGRAFYVPFGFGDARPAPTLPPCSVPMFGSVPVLGRHLHDAFKSIRDLLKWGLGYKQGDPPVKECAFCVRLEPSLRCLPNVAGLQLREAGAAHPNVVHLLPHEEPTHMTARFLASTSRSNRRRPMWYEHDNATTAQAMAKEHICNAATLEMAHEVSSIAWNAERVVQCVVAALASANLNEDAINGIICIDLQLPSYVEYRESWYNRRANQATDSFRRRRNETKLAYTNSRLALMRVKSIAAERKSAEEELGKVREALKNIQFDPTKKEEAAVLKAQAEVQEALTKRLEAEDQQLQTLYGTTKALGRSTNIAGWRCALAHEQLELAKRRLASEAEVAAYRAKQMLLGAVGIGMAMVSKLVSPMRVRLRALLLHEEDNAPYETPWALIRVHRRFASCEAVRLSEACVAISQLF